MKITYPILPFVLIGLVLVAVFLNINKKEPFDIATGLRHQPYMGKFDDCYQIGTRLGLSSENCKDLCNRTHSCRGISYRGRPHYECRLYNDAALENNDPRYVSWYKLKDANHLY